MFSGCFFPPLEHNFNRRELIFCGDSNLKNGIFTFLQAYSLGGTINDRAKSISNGPPNWAFCRWRVQISAFSQSNILTFGGNVLLVFFC